MRGFNLFYIVIIVLGLGLLYALGLGENGSPISFYGFAESEETEINYNFPVVIEAIMVSPGQEVSKGDTLLYLARKKSKETMDDYDFKISRLKAESEQWNTEIKSDIEILNQEKQAKLDAISLDIVALESELKFKKALAQGLKNVDNREAQFNPLQQKIVELHSNFDQTSSLYDTRIRAKNDELEKGQNHYTTEIEQIRAEEAFDDSQKVIPTYVLAPGDGIIGNISCKEEEHVPSYSTLLTFYEPHSAYVRGFVHEDLTLAVKKGDAFTVASLKDPNISYDGTVTGLGSRIIEIPTRLRKVPQMKSYGREIIVTIDKENTFLQKEKVALTHESSLQD